jgi:hypothetical protein
MEEPEKKDMPDTTDTHDDDAVTDDQLAAAWDTLAGKETPPVAEKKEEEAEEEVKVEEKVQEKKEEAPVVSPEFKAFQERIAALEAENAALKKPAEAVVEGEEEEQFVTNKNLDEVLTKRDQKRQEDIKKANAAYQTAYERSLATLAGTVDEDTFAEIFETMIENNGQNPYNKKDTGDAAVDVKINFANARARVIEKRAEKGYIKPNLATEKTNLATGITVNNREKVPEKQPIQLDEHAQALIKNSGLTDEEIKEALEGPAQFVYSRRQ